MVDRDAEPALLPGAPLPPRGNPVVDWITDSTRRDKTVISAVPPHFARYATIVIPDDEAAKTRSDAALVQILSEQLPPRRWWLGYLDTGVCDVVEPNARRLAVYVGWPYVLRQGGPQEALHARTNSDSTPWHSALPELLFPADRSWLVSTLWDDDWRCVGGPALLVDALLSSAELEARPVLPHEDATPPRDPRG